MTNIDIVNGIYAAFGKGDVPAILQQVHDDVIWEYGTAPNDVPWLAPRRGKSGVGQSFQTAAELLDFRAFEVLEVCGNERVVMALVRLEAVVKATGKTLREEGEVHVWHFDSAGKVVKFRHAADTFAQAQALKA